MRSLLLALALLAGAAPAAQAARADLLVVGKTRVLRAAPAQRLKPARVRVGHRSCAVAAATPLALLARSGVRLGLRDYGACGRRTRDAASLYVARAGPDRERGRNGWVYKLGRRQPSRGAGDPGVRVRAGARVLWFYCVMGARGCQRTLEVRPAARTVAAGAPLPVTVRGYDDRGRGRPVAGATVTLGPARTVTGADGTAVLTAPAASASLALVATRPSMVRSFREVVRVG